MDAKLVYELVGYAASLLVALSLLMVSIVKLRLFNLAGCLFFSVYGLLIGSIPIVLTNAVISLINIYHLVRSFVPRLEEFTYLAIGEPRRYTLLDFLAVWEEDVRRYYPLFNRDLLEQALSRGNWVYLALKKAETVGFALASRVADIDNESLSPAEKEIVASVREHLLPETTLYLNADYAVPKYRDIGLASLLYRRMEVDLPADIRYIVAALPADRRQDRRFLRRNGYRPEAEVGSYLLYSKRINEPGR